MEIMEDVEGIIGMNNCMPIVGEGDEQKKKRKRKMKRKMMNRKKKNNKNEKKFFWGEFKTITVIINIYTFIFILKVRL